jgi:hypothetical protein
MGEFSLPADRRHAFPGTRWSVIVAVGGGQTKPEGRAALESLCRAYWYPIYTFIRRRGHPPEEARDLTQEFFLRVLSGTFFERATPNSNASQIGIALSLGAAVTWWKGLQAGSIIPDQCQGSQNYQETNVDYSEFSQNPFVLWKAKTFGVHTAEYTVTDADSNM